MELFLPIGALNIILSLLAVIAGVFVITTKNAIISVFNLIVLYILVAFYLIYIGITYLGISYIIIYIGAIAILFLFVIMMIDVEVVEKRNNNYLPLLFLLLGGFFFTLKNIIYNIGIVKMKSLSFMDKEKLYLNTEIDLFNNLDKYNYKFSNKFSAYDNENIKDSWEWVFYNESVHENNNYDKKLDLKLIERDLNKKLLFNMDQIDEIQKDFKIDKLITSENDIKLEDWKVLSPNIFNKPMLYKYDQEWQNNSYLLVIPNWNSAVNRLTQISSIGDVLYTVYHSYIYILSILLLLGMMGTIILTGENYSEIKIVKIFRPLGSKENKYSSIYVPISIIKLIPSFINDCKNFSYKIIKSIKEVITTLNNSLKENNINEKNKNKSLIKNIFPYFHILINEETYSENIIGNLFYFVFANIIIAMLLLFINYYFSLSVKYLEKGGGFECGFTSFVQTRERFNIIFYRVSLLFLIFDLEIILIFPYTALYQKNENISKNNVLAFIYILVIGFIYELKEGAINIIKKAHSR
jgi:NADH:ubiquinone oxidoreductase subunit 6 (subunit J)/NADH:ubiquinone oxidoreductase subunit 3 (subunit A)